MLIGFIGAPSCGKSTTAFGLCYALKKLGYPTEFVPEYARRHIMDCRSRGIAGNGGFTGQSVIYDQDSATALLYGAQVDTITITDGCTVNCFFYNGFTHIDLLAEAGKYDMLFYIPIQDVPPAALDANRMQHQSEILALADQWERTIRPLMAQIPHIVELLGYPQVSQDTMLAQALSTLQKTILAASLAA